MRAPLFLMGIDWRGPSLHLFFPYRPAHEPPRKKTSRHQTAPPFFTSGLLLFPFCPGGDGSLDYQRFRPRPFPLLSRTFKADDPIFFSAWRSRFRASELVAVAFSREAMFALEMCISTAALFFSRNRAQSCSPPQPSFFGRLTTSPCLIDEFLRERLFSASTKSETLHPPPFSGKRRCP